MCKYCDYDSNKCVIFIEPLTNDWYYSHRTDEYDDDDWVYERIYINYCPWCGEKLGEK